MTHDSDTLVLALATLGKATENVLNDSPEIIRLVGRVPLVFVERQALLVPVAAVRTRRHRSCRLRLEDRPLGTETDGTKSGL